jgi:transcriptional regulator with AAA-type ATPase domain
MTEPYIDTLQDSPESHAGLAMTVQPYLFIVLECDRLGAGGARYALAGVDEIVIGRGTERNATRQASGDIARLKISVPGRSMSSTHARILRTGEGWVLEDACSTNGSYVNGSAVKRVVIRDGDVVELGHTLFLLREAVPTPKGSAADLDGLERGSTPPGFSTLLPEDEPRLEALARIAKSTIPILLLGESGTGKEVIARSIHHISARGGPFVAVNCGALPINLVESHLFGHAKGAYSGAVRDELGAVRTSDRGTLLLDEIGDLPAAAQPAFLRFLQEREVSPVGSSQVYKVDVRVVAATHLPLEDPSGTLGFRSDLLARLSGFTHQLRPLRERREDLGLLIAAILAKNSKTVAYHGGNVDLAMAPSVGRRLLAYPWRSNIRELEQMLLRALTLADGGLIEPEHLLHGGSGENSLTTEPHSARRFPPLSEEEAKLRAELVLQLERHHGSVSDVARTLGKARMQIHRWMKRFEIDPKSFRGLARR